MCSTPQKDNSSEVMDRGKIEEIHTVSENSSFTKRVYDGDVRFCMIVVS